MLLPEVVNNDRVTSHVRPLIYVCSSSDSSWLTGSEVISKFSGHILITRTPSMLVWPYSRITRIPVNGVLPTREECRYQHTPQFIRSPSPTRPVSVTQWCTQRYQEFEPVCGPKNDVGDTQVKMSWFRTLSSHVFGDVQSSFLFESVDKVSVVHSFQKLVFY